jgi:hypothetical protein
MARSLVSDSKPALKVNMAKRRCCLQIKEIAFTKRERERESRDIISHRPWKTEGQIGIKFAEEKNREGGRKERDF